jgi:hypothetical protein
MTTTINLSDRAIQQQYLSDPRLGRSDIEIRINACAALSHPWECYQHHDGSLWNGYGWPILENPPIPIAAEILGFWRYIANDANQWLTDGDDSQPHRLNPIAGLAVLQTRRKAHWDYLDALESEQRSLGDALDWGQPEFDADTPIEDLLAAGADPEDLIGAGILRDDMATLAVPSIAPALSPWANPNFIYQPPTAVVKFADRPIRNVDLTNPVF